jgi:hypothetical protein
MMKFSMESPSTPLSQTRVWTCALTNVLLCPGLGTIMARRRVGYFQLGLAIGGFLMTLLGLVGYIVDFLRTLETPALGGRPFWVGAGRMGIFVLAWLWSAISSVQLLLVKPPLEEIPPDYGKPPILS